MAVSASDTSVSAIESTPEMLTAPVATTACSPKPSRVNPVPARASAAARFGPGRRLRASSGPKAEKGSGSRCGRPCHAAPSHHRS